MPDKDELLAKIERPAQEAVRLHAFYKGKIQIFPKCGISNLSDFAIWYTPGVAAPCRAILADPDLVYQHTNKGNCILVFRVGTSVIGFCDLGAEWGVPVIEG